MRVLNVLYYPVFGGPQNEVVRLYRPLMEQGVELVVAAPASGPASIARMRASGARVHPWPVQRVRAALRPRPHLAFMRALPGAVRRLVQIIDDEGIDAVVTVGLLNPHAALAARICRKPLIWKIVDAASPWAIRRLLSLPVGTVADAVMFNGEATRAAHDARDSWAVPTFTYVPPVDVDACAPEARRRSSARAALGLPAEAVVVGTVANVNPLKGIDLFLHSAALLASQRPDVHFVVIGDRHETHATYWDEVHRLADAPPLRDRVAFAGGRDDVCDLIPAFDVKVIASRSEGTTTTALEAMACAVPVVAHDVGAVHEVVEDQRTGALVPLGDHAAMAEAIQRYLLDPDLARSTGLAGRRRVETQFSLQSCADVHRTAFEVAHVKGRPNC
jgi:glycosyltransferase involved in cell wall biosynthesis